MKYKDSHYLKQIIQQYWSYWKNDLEEIKHHQTHMEKLVKIPHCNGDKVVQICEVYDKININIRALEALKISCENYGCLLIPVIMIQPLSTDTLTYKERRMG